jgi:hypothetical protein
MNIYLANVIRNDYLYFKIRFLTDGSELQTGLLYVFSFCRIYAVIMSHDVIYRSARYMSPKQISAVF